MYYVHFLFYFFSPLSCYEGEYKYRYDTGYNNAVSEYASVQYGNNQQYYYAHNGNKQQKVSVENNPLVIAFILPIALKQLMNTGKELGKGTRSFFRTIFGIDRREEKRKKILEEKQKEDEQKKEEKKKQQEKQKQSKARAKYNHNNTPLIPLLKEENICRNCYHVPPCISDYAGIHDAQRFYYVEGDEQQQSYHLRCLNVLQHSINIHNDHPDHEELNAYVTAIIEQADLSYYTNLRKQHKTTDALLTFCEAVQSGLTIISRGLKRGACDAACDVRNVRSFGKQFVLHPIDTVSSIAQSITDATINLYNNVADLTTECLQEKSLMPIVDKANNTLLFMHEHIKTYLATHSFDEIIEDGIANITRCTLTGFTYQITGKILVSLGKFLLFLSSRQQHIQKLCIIMRQKRDQFQQQFITQTAEGLPCNIAHKMDKNVDKIGQKPVIINNNTINYFESDSSPPQLKLPKPVTKPYKSPQELFAAEKIKQEKKRIGVPAKKDKHLIANNADVIPAKKLPESTKLSNIDHEFEAKIFDGKISKADKKRYWKAFAPEEQKLFFKRQQEWEFNAIVESAYERKGKRVKGKRVLPYKKDNHINPIQSAYDDMHKANEQISIVYKNDPYALQQFSLKKESRLNNARNPLAPKKSRTHEYKTTADGKEFYYMELDDSKEYEKIVKIKPDAVKACRFVTEYDKKTESLLTWYECYDNKGNIKSRHPKMINGEDIYSLHYPLTKRENEKILLLDSIKEHPEDDLSFILNKLAKPKEKI